MTRCKREGWCGVLVRASNVLEERGSNKTFDSKRVGVVKTDRLSDIRGAFPGDRPHVFQYVSC